MKTDERPSRTASIAVGAAMVGALAMALVRAPRHAEEPAVASPIDTSVVPVAAQPSSAADRLDEAMDELRAIAPTEGNGTAKLLEVLDDVASSNVGRKMPDGSDPPPLPKGAPKVVRFGVILVKYRGAQLAPLGSASRDDALARAQELAKRARDDFAAAVKLGDPGSAIDIGTVRRGILEPAIEYALFTLPTGWVSDVIDTPRGFWVIRRIR